MPLRLLLLLLLMLLRPSATAADSPLAADDCNGLHIQTDGDGQRWFNDTAIGDCAQCQAEWLVIGLMSGCGLLISAALAFAGAAALRKLRESQAEDGNIGGGNSGEAPGVAAGAVHHAARSAEQIRHAWNTVATTTNGFQFLLLFQVNLSDLWPAMVTEWWNLLTRTVSLAFVRLEFIAEMFRSLCINQWVSAWVRLAAPFLVLSAVFAASRLGAWWQNRKIPPSMLRRAPNGRTQATMRIGQDVAELLVRPRSSGLGSSSDSDSDSDSDSRTYTGYRQNAAQHEAAGIAAVSLLYSVLASKVVEPFTCDSAEGKWWMRADRTIQCFSWAESEWVTMAFISAAIFAVGVVAFPAYLFRRLLRANDAQMSGQNRAVQTQEEADELNRELTLLTRCGSPQEWAQVGFREPSDTVVYPGFFRVRYGWLYTRYDERFWYWEFVIMARKLTFVAIGLIPSQAVVWALYLSLTVLALVAQVVYRPLAGRDHGAKLENIECLSQYRRQRLQDLAGGSANVAESVNLLVQSITVGLGGFFALEIIDEKEDATAAKAISVVLIAINMCTLLPALQIGCNALLARYRAARAGDDASSGSTRTTDAEAPLLAVGSE
jgi:hypothetical protein